MPSWQRLYKMQETDTYYFYQPVKFLLLKFFFEHLKLFPSVVWKSWHTARFRVKTVTAVDTTRSQVRAHEPELSPRRAAFTALVHFLVSK